MRGQGLNLIPGINLTAKPSRQRAVSLSEFVSSRSNLSRTILENQIQPKKNITIYPRTIYDNINAPGVAPSRTQSHLNLDSPSHFTIHDPLFSIRLSVAPNQTHSTQITQDTTHTGLVENPQL
jgi:hypothetical protein